ncbi:hypothetical protein N7471_009624 [Penicillium samsonianum]|uniref:uncharacterized protein n=1 Tax=Penicillium samsonianum TaxID=1882272 RepID=UPI002547B2D4|nr:uncharacterized protein N7471_009624 [Penicillium samsonianum]KAJ6128407.1 hypothetical protein N7471_009624 [Penicillium samsonianum]
MFCLRSWLPLLFIPTNASPTLHNIVCCLDIHHPPAIDYAISGNATSEATMSGEGLTEFVFDTMNSTAKALAGAALKGVQQGLSPNGMESRPNEWTGVGLEWMRSLLGRREWTLPCVDVKVRL